MSVRLKYKLGDRPSYKFKCSHWWKIGLFVLKSVTRFAFQCKYCNFIQCNERIEYITGHMTYNWSYTEVLQTTTTNKFPWNGTDAPSFEPDVSHLQLQNLILIIVCIIFQNCLLILSSLESKMLTSSTSLIMLTFSFDFLTFLKCKSWSLY